MSGGAQVRRLQEVEEQDGVLVDQVLDVGGDAPAGAHLLAVEDADGYRRVADVKSEQHEQLPTGVAQSFRAILDAAHYS